MVWVGGGRVELGWRWMVWWRRWGGGRVGAGGWVVVWCYTQVQLCLFIVHACLSYALV